MEQNQFEKVVEMQDILRNLGSTNEGDKLIIDAISSLLRRLNYSFGTKN
jgi:hypothetical protein